MSVYRIVLAAVAALALVAVAPEASGGGGTPVSSCGQVVTGNAVLTQDLVCAGDGIVVGASGITIDLKGFVIRGDRGSGEYGINAFVGYDDVTVKNGVVRNFDHGILGFNGTDRFRIMNVVVSGNVQNGIWIGGQSASVTSTTAAGNGSFGVLIDGSEARVKSTVATGNGLTGIAVGDEGQVTSSIASGNRTFGISAFANSVTIRSSTASGNGFSAGVGSAGILVSGDGASIQGNRADGNGLEAGSASDLQGVGIRVANYTIPPVGTNSARGNDDPAECSPATLC
jgi:hypothetical protein